ncbi:MAG: nucleoside hydrolase [Armatimonadota bacterium]|nr:nucleoside hydrolase [Armatimonadota bacterium]
MPLQLIIDTDAGVDDAIALLLALASPEHTVAAITTVSGNVPVDRVVRNVGIVLDAARAGDIPIFRGAEFPLTVDRVQATDVHGEDGLGDAGFPPSRRGVEGEDAVGALLRLARDDPGRYDLVTLGPLTNLALALAMEPQLPGMFRRITVMGGAVRGTGNVTPVAEFNVYADPEAAAVVFDRVPDLTLLPWEICLDCLVTFDRWRQLTESGPLGRTFVWPMTVKLAEFLRRRGMPGISLPDPLAMAAALAPGTVQTRPRRVDVETGGRLARGLTACADERRSTRPPNAQVVTAADMPRFQAMLERTFRQECGI